MADSLAPCYQVSYHNILLLDVMLNYNFYLHDQLDVDYCSFQSFIDPIRVKEYNRYNFYYTIDPMPIRINKQAERFAKFAVTSPAYANKFNLQSTSFDVIIDLFRRAYIYSYLKVMFYCVRDSVGTGPIRPMPLNSKTFYGHFHLYKTLICRNLQTNDDLNNSALIREITVDSDLGERLSESFPMYKELASDGSGQFYDPQLENVLNELSFKAKFLEIVNLGDVNEPFDISGETNPLGNACFSFNENGEIGNKDEVAYSSTKSVGSDPTSFFWNLACCITLAKPEDKIDGNDRYYRTVNTNELHSSTINFEIASITGWNPEGSTGSRSGGGQSPNNNNNTEPNNPSPSGDKPNDGGPNKGKGWVNRKKGKGGKPKPDPTDSDPNLAALAFRKGKEVARGVVSIVMDPENGDIRDEVIKSGCNLLSAYAIDKIVTPRLQNRGYQVHIDRDTITDRRGIHTLGRDKKSESSKIYITQRE